MPNRSSNKRLDLNELASQIVGEATGEVSPEEEPKPDDGKDPAAVALGRKGGLKGGKARAEKMTPEERSEAARRAAQARWGKGEAKQGS
ncbi:MAG: histone H1 [Armatimonadetes bacterium]|nr:histone H1 [Armatimonadota bacterium]